MELFVGHSVADSVFIDFQGSLFCFSIYVYLPSTTNTRYICTKKKKDILVNSFTTTTYYHTRSLNTRLNYIYIYIYIKYVHIFYSKIIPSFSNAHLAI